MTLWKTLSSLTQNWFWKCVVISCPGASVKPSIGLKDLWLIQLKLVCYQFDLWSHVSQTEAPSVDRDEINRPSVEPKDLWSQLQRLDRNAFDLQSDGPNSLIRPTLAVKQKSSPLNNFLHKKRADLKAKTTVALRDLGLHFEHIVKPLKALSKPLLITCLDFIVISWASKALILRIFGGTASLGIS